MRPTHTGRDDNGCKLGDIPKPSDIIMIGPRYCAGGDSLTTAIAYWLCVPQIHNGGDNYCFCDGHAKWMKIKGYQADMYWHWNWVD